MYGSYGSYSSMSLVSAPMDITSSNLRAHDASCAFPSWPQRASLSDNNRQERASSFLSDDDLFLSDPFEDDAHSISSASSTVSPAVETPPQLHDEADLMEMQRQQVAMQREFVRQVVNEKERRRQQAMMKKQHRRSSPGSKKSPRGKLASMAPIAESSE